jgi:hypothetical protein
MYTSPKFFLIKRTEKKKLNGWTQEMVGKEERTSELEARTT